MKGLDTPVLLGILHGNASAAALLKALKGEELATTELNMYELQSLALRAPRASRAARQKALGGLRRRISVVPITASAVEEAARALSRQPGSLGYGPVMWAAMAAAGCEEWITTRSAAPPKGATRLKSRIV
jgi:predicted nucleic acid-binding protein